MLVNFELIDDEAMDNVITSLNYKFDKIVYFGEEEVIRRQEKNIRSFLNDYCGIENVEFVQVTSQAMSAMRPVIKYKAECMRAHGDQVYVDITGGDCMTLVVIGDLAREIKVPMHIYDVEKDTLTEYDMGADYKMSTSVPGRKIKLDIRGYIALQGGAVNEQLHKESKEIYDENTIKTFRKLWEVEKQYRSEWTLLSSFLRSRCAENNGTMVKVSINDLKQSELPEMQQYLGKLSGFQTILKRLFELRLIRGLVLGTNEWSFSFTSEAAKDGIWEEGSTLELKIYLKYKNDYDDCNVGVHLDWDGIIHENVDEDVLNEVDVMCIKSNHPVFISCKAGKMSPSKTMHALYELETVATRFGGRYARKILVTAQALSNVGRMRAAEMGIEVVTAA